MAARRSWPCRKAFPGRVDPRWLIGAVLALAVAVLVLGVGIEGARRWVRVGPVLVHPASLCGSILLMALARAGDDGRSRVLAGAAGAALAMLPLPFLLAARVPGLRGGGLAVAGFWLGLAAAGAIGNYPAPVLGYGASPVIGWVLALGCMRRRTVQSAS